VHRTRLPGWAAARGAALNDFPALTLGRTALVNIDVQNAFLAEGQVFGNPYARAIVPHVNALSQAMREAAAPVIWTRQTHSFEPPLAPADWQYDAEKPGIADAIAALQAGSKGHALYPAVTASPTDLVVDKHRYGAFSCPAGALSKTLRRLGVEMVVVTGTLTNVCVESTAREANMAGYKVIVVADATAAVTDAEHNAALLNLRLNFADVRRTREVLGMIGALSRRSRSRG
jgi:nicotinamidase-related amidase